MTGKDTMTEAVVAGFSRHLTGDDLATVSAAVRAAAETIAPCSMIKAAVLVLIDAGFAALVRP